MEELSKACNEHGIKKNGRKMKASKQIYFMVKWNKLHVELWGERNFLCVLCFFTQERVRGFFGVI